MISILVGAAIGAIVVTAGWNFTGWAIVGWRHRGSSVPWPFGWRVFLGPRAYVKWAARKEFGVRLLNPVKDWE